MTNKNYAVVLNELGIAELQPVLKMWIKNSEMGAYIYCKSFDASARYFHMTIDETAPDNSNLKFEVQIQHVFIKCVFYSADMKRVGFT